jgi:hypothetical protein
VKSVQAVAGITNYFNYNLIALVILFVLSFEPFLIVDKLVLHPFIEQQNYTVDHFLSTWSDFNGGSFGAPALPMQLIGPFMVSVFGQSMSWAMLSGSMTFIAASGTFLLIKLVSENVTVRFIGALAYILSIAGMFFSFSSIGFSPPWAFFPFFIYFMWTAKKGTLFRNSFIIALMAIMMAGSNQTIVALYFLAGGLILIFKFVFAPRGAFLNAAKLTLIAVPLCLVLTAYYYLPEYILFSSSRDYFDIILSAEGPAWLNSGTSYFESVRMTGNIDMTYNWVGYSHPEWRLFYDSPLFLILSFIFPAISVAGIAFARKNMFAGFTAVMLLISLPFAIGGYPSFTGAIYMWFYNHIPYFSIFRDSYKLMIPVSLSYAVLLSVFAHRLLERKGDTQRKNKTRFLPIAGVGLIMALIVAIGVQPLTGRQTDRSSLIDIPQYWRDFGAWIRQQDGDFRVLMLPNAGVPSYKFTSHPGMHPEFFHQLMLNRDISVVSPTSPNKLTVQYAYNAMCESEENFASISRVLNLKYLVLQRDTNWDIYGFQSPDDAAKCIENTIGKSQPDQKFGNLDVYFLPESYQAPKIYGAYATSAAYADAANLFFEPGTGQEILYADYGEGTEPEITYEKENLWKYRVKIKTDRPFALVFSESFHPEWKAYYGNVDWYSAGFSDPSTDHRRINTYANAWIVPAVGEYEMTLLFLPQAVFYASVMVSIIGFGIVLALLNQKMRERLQLLALSNLKKLGRIP